MVILKNYRSFVDATDEMERLQNKGINCKLAIKHEFYKGELIKPYYQLVINKEVKK